MTAGAKVRVQTTLLFGVAGVLGTVVLYGEDIEFPVISGVAGSLVGCVSAPWFSRNRDPLILGPVKGLVVTVVGLILGVCIFVLWMQIDGYISGYATGWVSMLDMVSSIGLVLVFAAGVTGPVAFPCGLLAGLLAQGWANLYAPKISFGDGAFR